MEHLFVVENYIEDILQNQKYSFSDNEVTSTHLNNITSLCYRYCIHYEKTNKEKQYSIQEIVEQTVNYYFQYMGKHILSTVDEEKFFNSITEFFIKDGFIISLIEDNRTAIEEYVTKYIGYQSCITELYLASDKISYIEYKEMFSLYFYSLNLKYEKNFFIQKIKESLKYSQYLFKITFVNNYLRQQNFSLTLHNSEVRNYIAEFSVLCADNYYNDYANNVISLETIILNAKKEWVKLFMFKKSMEIEKEIIYYLDKLDIHTFVLANITQFPKNIIHTIEIENITKRIGIKYGKIFLEKIGSHPQKVKTFKENMVTSFKYIENIVFKNDIMNYVVLKNNYKKLQNTIKMNNWYIILSHYEKMQNIANNEDTITINIGQNFYPNNEKSFQFYVKNETENVFQLTPFGLYLTDSKGITKYVIYEFSSLDYKIEEVNRQLDELPRLTESKELLSAIQLFCNNELKLVIEGAYINEKYGIEN